MAISYSTSSNKSSNILDLPTFRNQRHRAMVKEEDAECVEAAVEGSDAGVEEAPKEAPPPSCSQVVLQSREFVDGAELHQQ